jgi:hypothetical protein
MIDALRAAIAADAWPAALSHALAAWRRPGHPSSRT